LYLLLLQPLWVYGSKRLHFFTKPMSDSMRNFEVTFIVDPVLSGDEIKATAQTYVDLLQKEGATIVHVDEMGLRQLAYPINKRTSGVYYSVEFQVETGDLIDNLELSFRRDERIIRFLVIRLDKYGVKYNQDKRDGKFAKKTDKKPAAENTRSEAPRREAPTPAAPTPAAPSPVVEEAPAAPAPAVEEAPAATSEGEE
jgi:small subunit ribosomal protein S6